MSSVLVVEDDPLVTKVYKTMLAPWVSQIDIVNCGIEAVQQAQASSYDLIIMDYGLPDMNGIQAAEEIGDVAPIVMITAYDSLDLIRRCMSANIADVFVKPISDEIIRGLVNTYELSN